MRNLLITLQQLLVTLYIASLIIFKMNYIEVTHIIGASMVINYIFLMFVQTDKKYLYNSALIFYFLFILLALVSSLWSVDFDNSSFKATRLLIQGIHIFIIYNSFKNFKMQNLFLYAILLGSLVNYLLLLNIVPAPFQIITEYNYRAFGTVGNPNDLAIIMIFSILTSIIFLEMKEKINTLFHAYQYLNILLALYIILLTASKKGAIFGLLLFLFFILQTAKSSQIFKVIVGGAVAITLLSNFIEMDGIKFALENTLDRFTSFETQYATDSINGSTGERKYFISIGYDLFRDSPILGYGLDSFRFLNQKGIYSHNNYIELLVGLGTLGFSLYYSIYFIMVRKVSLMENKRLRNLFLFFAVIMLSMDMALVSYEIKIIVIALIFILAFAERNEKPLSYI